MGTQVAAGFMGLQLSWLERTPDKREVGGSSPLKPTGHLPKMTDIKKEASDDAQKEAPGGAQVINVYTFTTLFIENYTLKQTSRIQNIQDIRGYSVRRLTE